MRKPVIGATLAVAALLTLGACGQAPWEDSLKDLEGVTVKDPDKATLYNNVDTYPNMVVLCIDGVAFVTTTRPDMGSWAPVPSLDKTCPPQ